MIFKLLLELKICCDHNFLLAKRNSEGTSDLKWSMAGDPKFKIFFHNFSQLSNKITTFPNFCEGSKFHNFSHNFTIILREKLTFFIK